MGYQQCDNFEIQIEFKLEDLKPDSFYTQPVGPDRRAGLGAFMGWLAGTTPHLKTLTYDAEARTVTVTLYSVRETPANALVKRAPSECLASYIDTYRVAALEAAKGFARGSTVTA